MTIFVVSHKDVQRLSELSTPYRALFVGDNKYALRDKYPNSETDDTGDNISAKNPSYCELTALYWIWKNCDDNYKGMVHYRRFFQETSSPESPLLSESDILGILNKYQLIVPKKYPLMTTVKKHYASHHHASDFELLGRAISEICPDYVDDFNECEGYHYFYPYNMLIANRNAFNNYINWMFSVLGYVDDNRTEGNDEVGYQSRWVGFLSERLMSVWLHHNRYSFYECDVPLPEISFKQKMSMQLGEICHQLADSD